MKKIICIALVAIMALSLVPAAYAVSDPIFADNAGKVDVLTGEIAYLNAPTQNFTPDSANEFSEEGYPRLTDGMVCTPLSSKAYFNKSWQAKTDDKSAEEVATEDEKNGNATCEFTLADGTVKKYFYEWGFEDLNCDVNSFAIYWSNEKDYSVPDSVVAEWQADAAFDILVSQDGGQTWTVAWESTRLTYKKDAEGNDVVDTMSALTVDKGGDWTHVEVATDTEYYWYRYIKADFNTEYKGVTNIAYGCVNPRREGKTTYFTTRAFYYIARITEFDAFGTNHKAAEVTETTAEETTAEQVEDTTASQIADTTVTQVEDTSKAPVETTGGEAAVTSKAPEEGKSDKGCSSSVAFAGVAVVMALGCVMLRKKRD